MKTRLSIEMTNVSRAIEFRCGQDLIIASNEKVKIMTTHCSWLHAKIPKIIIIKNHKKLNLQLLLIAAHRNNARTIGK